MDKSAEPSQTNKGFEDQIAEMSNSAPGSIADPTFDWHDFRDFLLNEENFDIILNALQKDAVAQSVLNKQQYLCDPTQQAPEAYFGSPYAVPLGTNFYQPANGVLQPSVVGQHAALPVTYSNHAAPIVTEGSGPAAPTSFTASAPQETATTPGKNGVGPLPVGPHVYIRKSPNGFILYLKEQRPPVKPELKIPESTAILTYLGTMVSVYLKSDLIDEWKSLPNHKKEKYYKNADVKKKCFSPATSISSATSTPQEPINELRNNGSASPAEPQVYIKKPPNAFMLFLKEQRPLVKPELKVAGSKAVLTYLGAVWKSLPKHQKEEYYKEAEKQRLLHKEQNPGWSTKDNYGKRLTKAGKRRLLKNSGT